MQIVENLNNEDHLEVLNDFVVYKAIKVVYLLGIDENILHSKDED